MVTLAALLCAAPMISINGEELTAMYTNSQTHVKDLNPPASEELKPFSERAKAFAPGQIYEHYKGKRYRIVSVARHSESLEETVVYEALYGDGDVWVRPIGMFFETVEYKGETLPRFKRVE